MSVSKMDILSRGLTNRCPNCGAKSLFPPRSLRIRRRCEDCGTGLNRGEGFFLGPWVLNYTLAAFIFVLPAIIAGVRGTLPWPAAFVLATLGCTLVPVFLYRPTWSWWLMLYFYFQPDLLPANGGPVGPAEED